MAAAARTLRLGPGRLRVGCFSALADTARDRSGREAIVRRVAADVRVVERHEPRPEEVGIGKTTADAVLGDAVAGHGAVVQHERWCGSAGNAEVEVGDPAANAGVSEGVVERGVVRDDRLVERRGGMVQEPAAGAPRGGVARNLAVVADQSAAVRDPAATGELAAEALLSLITLLFSVTRLPPSVLPLPVPPQYRRLRERCCDRRCSSSESTSLRGSGSAAATALLTGHGVPAHLAVVQRHRANRARATCVTIRLRRHRWYCRSRASVKRGSALVVEDPAGGTGRVAARNRDVVQR